MDGALDQVQGRPGRSTGDRGRVIYYRWYQTGHQRKRIRRFQTMNPEDIKLENPSKEFEYIKFKNNMDRIKDPDQLRDFALYFAKLYLRQQEVMVQVANLEAGGGI